VARIDPDVLELARGANLASLTTLMPGGAPVASVVWVDADEAGDRLLVNTERHRLKYRNVLRDPRVHLLVVDHADDGHYASVRGVVDDHVFGQPALDHIDRLAKKYTGTRFDDTRIVSERVILSVRPLHQRVRQSSVIVE